MYILITSDFTFGFKKKDETSKIKQNKFYADLYGLIVKKSCISTFLREGWSFN